MRASMSMRKGCLDPPGTAESGTRRCAFLMLALMLALMLV
jgi:hypothetical protein